MGTKVTVTSIPACDVCKSAPAFADASLPKYGGSWGYVCPDCFAACGCSLGTGRGQVLVLADSVEE